MTIRNTGSAPLENFASGAPLDPQFAITQNCAGGVEPGASCQYTFTFQPTATGVFSSTSNSATNAGPFVITLHGQSGRVVPSAELALSGVQVAATPQASTSGCGPATVMADAGPNTIDLAGARIGAGERCPVNVQLTALEAGAFTISTGPITTGNSGEGGGASAILQVTTSRFRVYAPLVLR